MECDSNGNHIVYLLPDEMFGGGCDFAVVDPNRGYVLLIEFKRYHLDAKDAKRAIDQLETTQRILTIIRSKH